MSHRLSKEGGRGERKGRYWVKEERKISRRELVRIVERDGEMQVAEI